VSSDTVSWAAAAAVAAAPVELREQRGQLSEEDAELLHRRDQRHDHRGEEVDQAASAVIRFLPMISISGVSAVRMAAMSRPTGFSSGSSVTPARRSL
jgi:hypothetical protein